MTPQELEAMRKLGQMQPSAPAADAYPESQQMEPSYSQSADMMVQPASPQAPQRTRPDMFVGEGEQNIGEDFANSMNDVFEGRSQVITPVEQLINPPQQNNVPLLDLTNPSKKTDEGVDTNTLPVSQKPKERLMDDLKSEPLPQATNGDVAARKDAVAAPQARQQARPQPTQSPASRPGGIALPDDFHASGRLARNLNSAGQPVNLPAENVRRLTGENPPPVKEDTSGLKDTFDQLDSLDPLVWWNAVHKQETINPGGSVAQKLNALRRIKPETYRRLGEVAARISDENKIKAAEKAKLDRDILQEKAKTEREDKKEEKKLAAEKEKRDWESKEGDRKAERDKRNRIEEKRIAREESEQAIQREKDKDTEAKLTSVEEKFLDYDRGPDGKIMDPAVQQRYEQERAAVVRYQRNKNPKYPGWKLERDEQRDASLESRYGARSAQHEKEFALRQRKDAINELISMRKGTEMAGKLPTEDEINEYMNLMNPESKSAPKKASMPPEPSPDDDSEEANTIRIARHLGDLSPDEEKRARQLKANGLSPLEIASAIAIRRPGWRSGIRANSR